MIRSGTAKSIHWKQGIFTWQYFSIMAMPMRLGGVPTGVPMPPAEAANYPLIAREVRQGRSGVTSTFNVGGYSASHGLCGHSLPSAPL
jgi:hypothetical protein